MKKIANTNYYVDEYGEVYNKNFKKLKQKIKKTGYCELGLIQLDGSVKWCLIHRLVAQTYIENPENKPFVNHIDGNKLNNCVDNLEWVTHQENMDHAKRTKLIHYGERNKNSVLTEELAHKICKLLQEGYRNYDITKMFSLGDGIVSSIRLGVTWVEISSQYNIPKRSRAISDSTIHWICKKIVEGLTQGEIIRESTNRRITKTMIKDIRRKRIYRDISINYF